MKRLKRAPKSTKSKSISWEKAPDIKKEIALLKTLLNLPNIQTSRIFCFRSQNAKTKAYARIWGLPRLWQMALKSEPAYILEVIAERFDKLDKREQHKVLLHELAHIPKNFSGSLLPHTHKRKGNFHDKLRRMLLAYDEH
jgi:predicted metallopeptidase